MTHSYVWHNSIKSAARHIYIRDMTHSYMWHDASICLAYLIHVRDITHDDAFTRVTGSCLPKRWDMGHESPIFGTWLIYMCDMNHSYVGHDSFVCATRPMPIETLLKSVSQCVAVYCSTYICVAVCCSVLQCVAVCCSVLQCVAVCCGVLQFICTTHGLLSVWWSGLNARTHSHVGHYVFICGIWLIYMWGMTHMKQEYKFVSSI